MNPVLWRRNEHNENVGHRADRLGGLGLAYGGFTYTRSTHEAKLGPIELSVTDKETVNVPVGAGAGAVIVGLILLSWRKPD